jgi:hypothetical protein
MPLFIVPVAVMYLHFQWDPLRFGFFIIPSIPFQKRYFPKAHGKFIQVKNMKAWEGPTFDFLESVAMRIETRNGRLNPTVIGFVLNYYFVDKTLFLSYVYIIHCLRLIGSQT